MGMQYFVKANADMMSATKKAARVRQAVDGLKARERATGEAYVRAMRERDDWFKRLGGWHVFIYGESEREFMSVCKVRAALDTLLKSDVPFYRFYRSEDRENATLLANFLAAGKTVDAIWRLEKLGVIAADDRLICLHDQVLKMTTPVECFSRMDGDWERVGWSV